MTSRARHEGAHAADWERHKREFQRESWRVLVHSLDPVKFGQMRADYQGPPVPTQNSDPFGRTTLNILKMSDGAHYAVFSDGSFRRVPRRRRFLFGTPERQLSGRQLRLLRKRTHRALLAEQRAEAGTSLAASVGELGTQS